MRTDECLFNVPACVAVFRTRSVEASGFSKVVTEAVPRAGR
jgi:hypothetical protein